MGFNMARTENAGPWKMCKQTASVIIKFMFGPVLYIGGKLSEHPDIVVAARKLAKNDHYNHQLTDFDIGGGSAANPKEKV